MTKSYQLPLNKKLSLCEQFQQPRYNLVEIAPGVRIHYYKVWAREESGQAIELRNLPDQSTRNAHYATAIAAKVAWTAKNNQSHLDQAIRELHEAIDGMLAYLEITGIPGYLARNIVFEPQGDANRPGKGRFSHLYWRGSPAQGTYATYVQGLAALWYFSRNFMDSDHRMRLQKALQAIAVRLIDTKYYMNQGVTLNPGEDDYGNWNPYLLGKAIYNPFSSWDILSLLSIARHSGSSDRLIADFPPEERQTVRSNLEKIWAAWDAFREKDDWYRGGLIDPLKIMQYVKHMSEDSHIIAAGFTILASELSLENPNNWNPKIVQYTGRMLAGSYNAKKILFVENPTIRKMLEKLDIPIGLGKEHPGGPIINKAGNPWFHAVIAYLFRQKDIRRGLLGGDDPDYAYNRMMRMAKDSEEEAYKILQTYDPDTRVYMEPKNSEEFREDWNSEYGTPYVPLYARPSGNMLIKQNGYWRSTSPKTEATVEGAGGGAKIFMLCSGFSSTYWMLKNIPPTATCNYPDLGHYEPLSPDDQAILNIIQGDRDTARSDRDSAKQYRDSGDVRRAEANARKARANAVKAREYVGRVQGQRAQQLAEQYTREAEQYAGEAEH